MSNTSKTAKNALDRKMIVGVQKHLKGSLLLANKSYTADEVVALLQQRVDADAAVSTTKSAYANAVAQERTVNESTKQFFDALIGYLRASYGQAIDTLGDFGIAPRKQGKPNVKTRAAGIDKNLATRSARHTMGSRQKLSVKGEVHVTPPQPTAPAAPVVTTAHEGNAAAPNGAAPKP
jgi:hypothetical protein